MTEEKGETGGWRPGRKDNLAGLIAYHEGSVVSRTIINRKTGTVTLFAFDEGEGLSEHTAPYDALLFLVEGQAVVTVDGKENRMTGGDAVILPSGKPHSVNSITRFKMLLVMIRS